jgi:hypothetical protein
MPRATANAQRFACTHCGAVSTARCRKCGAVTDFDLTPDPGQHCVSVPIYFNEANWQRLGEIAKATPGVDGPLELLRMALLRLLSIPPIVLGRKPSGPSKRR